MAETQKLRFSLVSIILTGTAALSTTLGQTTPSASETATATAARAALTPLTAGVRNLRVHDPSTIVKCGDEYWVFYTGRGVGSAHSKDLINWQRGPNVVTASAEWATTAVPNNQRNDCWAPDAMKIGDKYFLYYSVSTFGSRDSAIGLATTPTLDVNDKNFKWADQGMVMSSRRSDNFNAIDPAIAKDTQGGLWLSFGSFWSGVKMIQLDPKTGKRIAPDSKVHSLAHNNQIEAPYIYHHGKYFYLFVNWGKCCTGAQSTYNIRVGRSEKITGPYLDQAGVDMMNNGGTLVLQSEDPFIGPGHAGIVEVDGKEWLSFHYESAPGITGGRRGGSPLGIRPLSWNQAGWPVVERMPDPAATKPAVTTPAGSN